MSVAWTHTMTYDDVRAMLAVACDGMELKTWRAEAERSTRLLVSDRRATQLRIAAAILRPVNGRLVNDGFLSDLACADASAAHDLIYARYLASVPLARTLAAALWGESRERRNISRECLEAALRAALPSAAVSTVSRSRTAFLTELSRAGALRSLRDGGCELIDADPAPAAVFHLLLDDLRERREASDAWVMARSLPVLLFALSPERMRAFIEGFIETGRVRRSYYAGEPRVLAA